LKKKKKERINIVEMEDSVKGLRNAGSSLGLISQELGISKSSVQNILNKIDKREKLGELREKEEELRDKERRLVQKEREIKEKERRSDEKIAKRFRDAELELKKTKGKKEEYEGRIGEIKKREKEANKFFDEIKGLGLVLEEVLNVAYNYKAFIKEKESLKKNISNLRNERAHLEKEIDYLRIERTESLRENHSLLGTVASLREQQNVLTYQVACLEREKVNLESVKSEIEREKFRLSEINNKYAIIKNEHTTIKNEYATIKKNLDDLLSLGKSRINENLKAYKDEELSKMEKYLDAKKLEFKKWDHIISSKKEESDALINQIKELMDTYLGLRKRILFNIDRCDSLVHRKEFEKVLNDLNKGLVNIIGSKQPATLMGAKARGVVYDVVFDALRKNGIAIPEI